MNECDAPESNNTYAKWESMVNIPAIMGSPYEISSALVKLTHPERLTGTFFPMIVVTEPPNLYKIKYGCPR